MKARGLIFALTTAWLLLPQEAAAQVDTRDYRRADRKLPESPQRFAFELRMGPYKPRVDDEFSGKTPFADTFGDGKGFHIGAEIDWQAWRIPHFGTLGPGFSFAYTSRSAKAKITGTTKESSEETTLKIMPMIAVGVLRIDVLTRDLGIPLVPYGKAGYGMGFWSVTTDKGVVTRDGVEARGRSWGTHLAVGGMLHLDFLEPDTALAFDDEMGVNNTYLFFEWMWSDLGTSTLIESKPQMHVGTSGWAAGLAMEFLGLLHRNDQGRARRPLDDPLGDATEGNASEARASVGPDHDQIHLVLRLQGEVTDLLVRDPVHHDALAPEAVCHHAGHELLQLGFCGAGDLGDGIRKSKRPCPEEVIRQVEDVHQHQRRAREGRVGLGDVEGVETGF